MRLTSALAWALTLAPCTLTAAKELGKLGFSLGAVNVNGSSKSQSDYEADMKAIKAQTGSTMVRIYAASQSDTAKNILPAAKAQGFQVVMGVWVIDGNETDSSFTADTAAIAAVLPDYADQIHAVTIGSEGLYRKAYTAEQLLAKINRFNQATNNAIKNIGFADTWNMIATGQADALVTSEKVNFFAANAFAYWQNGGQDVTQSTAIYFDDIYQSLDYVQKKRDAARISTNFEFWTGETGWPTDGGSDYGAAKAGTKNAKYFWDNSVCVMLEYNMNVFYFEAFDEPQKPDSIGESGVAAVETKWGAMNADRTIKFDLTCPEPAK